MSDEVHRITIQLKAPRGRDPGKIEIGHYVVVEGYVVLTDEDGKPTGDGKRLLNPGDDAKAFACTMLRSSRRYGSRPSGFGFYDKLEYPRLKY